MSRNYLLSCFVGLNLLAASGALAEDRPTGKLIELHSCEVYAGGCTVCSEALQGGRCMLQVWDVTAGSWQGVDLAGLKAAVLASSPDNLADRGARVEASLVYLPKDATAAQQSALLAWLKSGNPQLASSQTRVVPISLVAAGQTVKVKLGHFASFDAVSLGECPNRACGEDLWYEPTAQTTRFTVALNQGSQVNEPLLKLRWTDQGKRSAFVARFGESGNAHNLFVNSTEWCGPASRLF